MPFSSIHRASETGCKYRILIIDDSPDDLHLLVKLLKGRGYQLSIARDGHNGYQLAASQPPDLILLDVYMPRADGFTACRLLKTDQRTRDIPVIFLTAANDKEARLKGFALGAVDFISKPYIADEVLARVAVHVDLARRARPVLQDVTHATTGLNADEVMVNAVKSLLLENIAEPLSMAELVEQLGTGERRLNELFREYAGMTVFVWLREARLREARRLLAVTTLDIATIAEQLGYHSQSHFANAFKENAGVSPREYRASLVKSH